MERKSELDELFGRISPPRVAQTVVCYTIYDNNNEVFVGDPYTETAGCYYIDELVENFFTVKFSSIELDFYSDSSCIIFSSVEDRDYIEKYIRTKMVGVTFDLREEYKIKIEGIDEAF